MTFRFPSLAECTVLLLIATLAAASVVLSRQEARVQDLAVARTLENAQLLIQFARKAHEQYARSVRSSLKAGIRPTTESTPPAGTVHFPATFSRQMTHKYAESADRSVKFRIYSADPFPTTPARTLDDFANTALEALLAGEQRDYWQLDEAHGLPVVRYAAPIQMRENCIACHNNPKWKLKNQNWTLGDVRGVWEVSLVVQPALTDTRTERAVLLGLMLIASSMGLFVVYPTVKREVARRTHFEQLSGDLDALAKTDALTGLANRRAFDDAISKAIADRHSNEAQTGLIILDIDHFKSVNDTYGHQSGDRIIARVGKVLRDNVRPGDFPARIGGEEFAVLCQNVPFEELGLIAERVRTAIEAEVFDINDIRLNVTASLGAAILKGDDDHRSFFRNADQLLYRAKQKGRNAVCISPEPGATLQA